MMVHSQNAYIFLYITLVIWFFQFTWRDIRLVEFYVFYLRAIVRHIANNFESPRSYNSWDRGVHTDSQAIYTYQE